MQHFKLRCKHCHTEYTYCTYGNGSEYGTEEGCSKEYCARCQKAIDNALAKIPVECQPKYMEIHDPRIFEMFERVKKNYKESVKKNPIEGLVFETLSMSLYDNTETYIHNGIEYKVEWDDDTPEDKHVFIYAEFNLAIQSFTGKPWRKDGIQEFYSHRKCLKLKHLSELLDIEKPMEEPSGMIFYTDPRIDAFDFGDIETLFEKKPEHIKRIHTSDLTGFSIKVQSDTKKFNCSDTLDMTNLENILMYECTFEKYDDEDKSTLIGIKVK